MPGIKEATDRIVQQFADKGIALDAKKVEADVTKLVKEFGMSQQEAERTVSSREARDRNISLYEGQHKGGGVVDIASVKDKDWVVVEGMVTLLTEPVSKSIHQQGIFSDRSGDIRFVVWARKKGASTPVTEMRVGKWYRITSGTIDTFQNALNLRIHSKTTVQELPDRGEIKPKITAIKDLKPGIVNLKVKVQRLFESRSDKIFQTGVVGDATGTAKFTIWKSTAFGKPLQDGKAYYLDHAQCVDYKGAMNLVVSNAKEISEDIQVKATSATFRGNIVQIRTGSGLVKRCPVTGCGRVLSRQNYCQLHEIQKDFVYDMRIKAVLDDGEKARNIHIPLKVVEAMTGMTLKEAISLSEKNPMSDDVMTQIRQKFLFKYYDVEGIEFPDRLVITKMTPVKPDMARAKTLAKVVE